MDRRTFLVLSGVGALAGAAPLFLKNRADSVTVGETGSDAISQTASQTPSQAASQTAPELIVAQATGYRPVGSVSQLANGNAIHTQVGSTRLVVIRNPSDPNAIVALNQRCSHQGCSVDWQASQGTFVCPCHNAQFSASGAVVRGPARTGLQHYAARIEGDQVTVQV